MRASFKLPSSDEFPLLAELLEVVFDWIDIAGVLKQVMPKQVCNSFFITSIQSLARLQQTRLAGLQKEDKKTHKERQEAAMKRRDEKLQKQKESLTTPEAKAKFEEKLRKKELKQRFKVIKY